MAQRRHHYEQAFESFLRDRRIPYIAVDEAKRALLPPDARLKLVESGGEGADAQRSLKSFDFVIYGLEQGLIVEVKGRRIIPRKTTAGGRLESWATQEDLAALRSWQQLFGSPFLAALVFVYWCDEMPATPLFEDVFDFRGRWYAVRAIEADAYVGAMRPRSPRWGTVDLSPADFDRLSRPLCAPIRR